LIHLLSALIAITALALIRVRNLFAVVMLLSVYSALLSAMFAIMGSVDVAFMEAVVGTSMSTVFLMGLMWWVNPDELALYGTGRRILAILPAAGLGGILLYGVNALPAYGDPLSPASMHISPVYAAGAVPDMATPNVVAAVLADYRGYDTMIEAAVVVTAVLGCLLVLKYRDATSV
ncbi:MAG: hydrogen gas-evolving membrane-bound hydrogenase subunit E, partial [Gemmatimonadales bacterium]